MKQKRKTWSDDDCERLKSLVASGASPVRASLALKRPIVATKNKARNLGVPFPPDRERRKKVREISQRPSP
jgi:hypothetical protein